MFGGTTCTVNAIKFNTTSLIFDSNPGDTVFSPANVATAERENKDAAFSSGKGFFRERLIALIVTVSANLQPLLNMPLTHRCNTYICFVF